MLYMFNLFNGPNVVFWSGFFTKLAIYQTGKYENCIMERQWNSCHSQKNLF